MKYPSEKQLNTYFTSLWQEEKKRLQTVEAKIHWVNGKIEELQYLKARLINVVELMENHIKKLNSFDEFFEAVISCIQKYLCNCSNSTTTTATNQRPIIALLTSSMQFIYAFSFEVFITINFLISGDIQYQSESHIKALCKQLSNEVHSFDGYQILKYACSNIQNLGKAFWDPKSQILIDMKGIDKQVLLQY
jgi:hypothetical protein